MNLEENPENLEGKEKPKDLLDIIDALENVREADNITHDSWIRSVSNKVALCTSLFEFQEIKEYLGEKRMEEVTNQHDHHVMAKIDKIRKNPKLKDLPTEEVPLEIREDIYSEIEKLRELL